MAEPQALRVLQVGAEIYPLVKTGGLGDVMAALPPALAARGVDCRLLLPGYPSILQRFESSSVVAYFGPAFGAATIVVRFGKIQGVAVPAYVIDAPFLYDRIGGPYSAADGRDWPDNPRRYGALGWIAAHLGCGDIDWRWRPQIVHGHDWHAGLAPAYLALHPAAPCQSVFTVHNLAFHGLFEREALRDLMLPERMFSPDGVEFHGTGSFIKAGLRFAGRISTVSPSYAREIQTEEFGCGLEGLIAQRRTALRGILNGVDTKIWDPAADPLLAEPFAPAHLEGKAATKAALQAELGLQPRPDALTIGVVSRLTHQKGMDLLARSLADLTTDGIQFAIIGSGDRDIERALTAAAVAQPRAVAVKIGYDEQLAHRVIGGSDVICVPSRFEPCGLTQMYGLRYGTLPLVRRVGGLADTVVDADAAALGEDRATGFVFDRADAPSLVAAARRALQLYRSGAPWTRVVTRAMNQDFSWNESAGAYIDMYRELVPAT
jgi:starch synthase